MTKEISGSGIVIKLPSGKNLFVRLPPAIYSNTTYPIAFKTLRFVLFLVHPFLLLLVEAPYWSLFLNDVDFFVPFQPLQSGSYADRR